MLLDDWAVLYLFVEEPELNVYCAERPVDVVGFMVRSMVGFGDESLLNGLEKASLGGSADRGGICGPLLEFFVLGAELSAGGELRGG